MKGAQIAYVQLRANMIIDGRVKGRKEEIIKPLREHVRISPLMVPISSINCEAHYVKVLVRPCDFSKHVPICGVEFGYKM